MPMEGSTKVKIVAAIAVVLVAGPIYMLTDGFLGERVNDAWEKAGGRPTAPSRDGRPKDPESAERLYKIAWIFKITFRPEQCAQICHDWLIRYGGDEGDEGTNRILIWEPRIWTDENPRPDYYPTSPHPLTAKVIAMYADYWEHKRMYSISRPLWDMIVARYQKLDPKTAEEAEKAILRDKTRTF